MDVLGNLNNIITIVNANHISATKASPELHNFTLPLQNFLEHQVLRGTVQQRSGDIFTIQSEQGLISIKTDIPLKRGFEVAIRIESHLNELIARLISVNDMSIAKYVEQHIANLLPLDDEITPTSSLLRAQSAPAPPPHSSGDRVTMSMDSSFTPLIRGVFLAPPTLSAAHTAVLPALLQQALSTAQTGTSLQIHLQQIILPATLTHSDVQPLFPTTPLNQTLATLSDPIPIDAQRHTTPAAPMTSYRAAVQQMMHAPLIQSVANNHLAATSLPLPDASAPMTPLNASMPPPPSHTPSAPHHMMATVLPHSNPRELLLQSPLGTFKLFVTEPMPVGTILEFTLEHVAPVRGGTPTPSSHFIPTEFEAIRSIADLPHPSAVIAPHSPPIHIVPHTGSTLTAELLFLFTALYQNDMRRWLGDTTMNELELGENKPLLSQLSKEFSAMNAPPAPHDRDGTWHNVMIPLMHEQQIHPVHMFFKRSRHTADGHRSRDTDHFMVDIELTRMGRMQLDGLVQKTHPSMRFDLIIRTEQLWGNAIEQDICAIFMRAQEISGAQGSLQFRHGKDAILPFPIDNTASGSEHNTHSIVV
ncbi:MAG: hypothetical protein EAY76_02315 [Alphaproteobacteria bacterium]|nr:MAG: hypothetical protein EAY76_02315 [Alphaproteobacteria bacterium]